MSVHTPSSQLKNPELTPPQGYRQALDLRLMFFLRNLMNLEWSADSTSLYFETNITGRYSIWRMPADGGFPLQLTVDEDRTELQRLSPDGRYLVYSQDHNGDEKPNLFFRDVHGFRAFPFTRTSGIAHYGPCFSPDSQMVAWSAELEGPGKYGVYLAPVPKRAEDLESHPPEPQCLVPSAGFMWDTFDWSRDGRFIALTVTRDGLHRGVAVVSPSGELRILVEDDGAHRTLPVAFTADSRFLLCNSNRTEDERTAPVLIEVETGALHWLADSAWDTYGRATSADGRLVAWTLNEAGSETLYVMDLSSRTLQAVPMPPGVFTNVRFSPDGTRLAFLYTAADCPPDIWVMPLNGQPRQVSFSLAGGLEPRHLVRPHLVTYPSYDETPIASYLYLPRGAKKEGRHPGLVIIRGGPTAQTQNRFSRDIQYFASRGFVVIAPNYRGSLGFGRAFQEANRRDLGGGDLKDIIAARTFLLESGYVDPKKVVVMGGSFGGYLTLMALTKAPDLWAAGVAVVPFANWFTEFENEDPTLQAFDKMMMGDPVENRDFWIDRSPYFFVDQIKAPLLLLAGGNDIRCPASETREIEAKIKEAGGEVEAKIYEDEGHGFIKRENAIDSFQRTVRFLEKHILSK